MTVAEAIELVYLNVVNGKPSDDVLIYEEDIRTMLPAAINYVLTAGVWENRKEVYEDIKVFGYGHDNTTEFSQLILLLPVFDAAYDLYFITLPKGFQHLPGGRGLLNLYSKDMSVVYPKAQSYAEVAGLNFTSYWGYTEVVNTQKIWITNYDDFVVDPLDPYVRLEVVYDAHGLSDSDRLPIGPGQEMMVLQLLTDWFNKQRSNTSDDLNNLRDDEQDNNYRQGYPRYSRRDQRSSSEGVS